MKREKEDESECLTNGISLSILTLREREVLGLLADGRSNSEIATELSITTHTAKAHVSNILRKLGVETRTEAAVAWARSVLRTER